MDIDNKLDYAVESVSVIRDILDRAMVSYKKLGPSFLGLGVSWAAFAVIKTILSSFELRFALNSGGMEVSTAFPLAFIALELLLCGALLATYLSWGRTKAAEDLNPMAGKLIDIWRVFAIAFVASKLLLLLAYPAAAYLFSSVSGDILSPGAAYGGLYASRLLSVIFPALPLIISARFIENRKMAHMGRVIFALSALWLVLLMVVIDASTATFWSYFLRLAFGLLAEATPAAALLALGAAMKKA